MNFELDANILLFDAIYPVYDKCILTLTSCHHGYPVNYYYYDIQQIIVISMLTMILVTMDTQLSDAMIYKDLHEACGTVLVLMTNSYD